MALKLEMVFFRISKSKNNEIRDYFMETLHLIMILSYFLVVLECTHQFLYSITFPKTIFLKTEFEVHALKLA